MVIPPTYFNKCIQLWMQMFFRQQAVTVKKIIVQIIDITYANKLVKICLHIFSFSSFLINSYKT